MKRFLTLLAIELKLALRSRDMVLFAILMPVIVLIVVRLVFGAGADGDPGMVEATIGAFLAIGICAVGLTGLPLTLAEYRSRKVLKRLQVTPVHPAMLLGPARRAVRDERCVGGGARDDRGRRRIAGYADVVTGATNTSKALLKGIEGGVTR